VLPIPAVPRPEVSRTKTMPVLPLTLRLDVTMRTARFNTKNAAVLHTMSSYPLESLINHRFPNGVH